MTFAYRSNDVLVVFTHNRSKNRKIIGDNRAIVQQYAFSHASFEAIKNGESYLAIFENDQANCLACPYSRSNGYPLGKCYTHKYHQGVGMKALLKSVIRRYNMFEEIPVLPETIPDMLLRQCKGKFVRFGTYGETTFVPFSWFEEIIAVAKSWTGYTHTWTNCDPRYARYLMASVHSQFEQNIAADMGWRSFLIFKEERNGNVLCPADRANVTCAKCALCSGTEGKGTKSVEIKYH